MESSEEEDDVRYGPVGEVEEDDEVVASALAWLRGEHGPAPSPSPSPVTVTISTQNLPNKRLFKICKFKIVL